VILVIDCASMSHSVAALAQGFANFHPDVLVAGVILNRVASARHEGMLRQALDRARINVVGALRRDARWNCRSAIWDWCRRMRHAGLGAVDRRRGRYDGSARRSRSGHQRGAQRKPAQAAPANISRLPPLAQKIAVARDIGFAFAYEHMLLGWRRRGAEISFFLAARRRGARRRIATPCCCRAATRSLHAGQIAAAQSFKAAMGAAIARGVNVYGECGGYMVLGDALIDADGVRHEMLGALPLVTSFAQQKRQLGYRRLAPKPGLFWDMELSAHEFHYASIVSEGDADRVFSVQDALGAELGTAGLRRGSVAGSFMHVIDRTD
jgi:cobyrinic acid a,c-diamide synthase